MRILIYPDKRLRKIAKMVTKINETIYNIIDNMFKIMYIKNGIGLAATQVNIHQQIIVIDVSKNRDQGIVIINPKIIEKKGKTGINEGCLSIPDKRGFVIRAEKIKILALDRNGNSFELETENLLAICIQHEIDHLMGKLFIDYLSS